MNAFDLAPLPPPSSSAEQPIYRPSTEFKAVENGGESRDGATLMVEAYVVLWVLLMGWIFLLWRKQGALNTRLDDLEKAIDKRAEAMEANATEKKA